MTTDAPLVAVPPLETCVVIVALTVALPVGNSYAARSGDTPTVSAAAIATVPVVEAVIVGADVFDAFIFTE